MIKFLKFNSRELESLYEDSLLEEKRVLAQFAFFFQFTILAYNTISKFTFMDKSLQHNQVTVGIFMAFTFIGFIINILQSKISPKALNYALLFIHLLCISMLAICIVSPQENRLFTADQLKMNWIYILVILTILQGLTIKNFRLFFKFQTMCWSIIDTQNQPKTKKQVQIKQFEYLPPTPIHLFFYRFYIYFDYFSVTQVFILNLLFFCGLYLIFYLEKFNQLKFLESIKSIDKNQKYQLLYDDYLIFPIIQTKMVTTSHQDEIFFFNINKSFKNAFQIVDEKQLEQESLRKKIFKELRVINTEKQQALLETLYEYSSQDDNTVKTIICAYGESQHYSITLQKIVWEQEKSIIVILTEISLQLELQKIQEINKCKDSLMDSVSHELKTPINSLLTYIQTACQRTTDQKIKNLLNKSLKTTNMLFFIISDFLDYSQINHQNLRPCPSQFNLDSALKDVLDIFQFSASQKNIQLILDSKLKTSQVYTDSNRIKQVVANLVSNAIQFTQQGFIKVIIQQSDQDQEIINITVEDSGFGIEEQILGKLFIIFGTIGQDKQTNTHGVGLGLTICRNIVQIFGPEDKINVETEIGVGSKFSFQIFKNFQEVNIDQNIISQNSEFIKLQQEEEEKGLWDSIKNFQQESIFLFYCSFYLLNKPSLEINEEDIEIIAIRNFDTNRSNFPLEKPSKSNLEEDQEVKTSKKIKDLLEKMIVPLIQLRMLIVDDNPFNVDALQTLFEDFSDFFQIYTALSGTEAITTYVKINYQFDIIFMDINMPNKDGFQTTKEILDYSKTDSQIPKPCVCFVSAYEVLSNAQYSCTENYFISKPVDKSQFLSFFQSYFQMKKI